MRVSGGIEAREEDRRGEGGGSSVDTGNGLGRRGAGGGLSMIGWKVRGWGI